MRDPRVAQARLGSLVFIFRRKMDGVAGRGERSDTCQTVFHFVPCDAARAGSVAPLGPSPRRSARRASTRARGATGAEAEDAAAGAYFFFVGGAWVTPGPRRFSDRVAPQTPVRCPRPSSSPRRARPRTSWSRPDPARGQARKRLNARNLDSRFPMDSRARLTEKHVARKDPREIAVCVFKTSCDRPEKTPEKLYTKTAVVSCRTPPREASRHSRRRQRGATPRPGPRLRSSRRLPRPSPRRASGAPTLPRARSRGLGGPAS